jgi:hypothetical protein
MTVGAIGVVVLGAVLIFQGVFFRPQMIVVEGEIPSDNPVATTTKPLRSDLSTYRNEKYGFELMYPPQLFVREGQSEAIVTLAATGSPIAAVKIYYWDEFPEEEKIHTINELFAAVKRRYKDESGAVVSVINHGGFEAIRVDGLSGGIVSNEPEVFVLLEQGILNVYPGGWFDSMKKISSALAGVSADSTSTVPSDWKTYRNEKY